MQDPNDQIHDQTQDQPQADPTLAHWRAQTQARQTAQLYRQVRVLGSDTPYGQVFCSNDYLGLMRHPALAAALGEGAKRYGSGSGGSHLISGHSPAHVAQDAALAAWFAPHIADAAALSFSTGYMANLALLTALADEDTALFCDALNHASLIDGAQLAKQQKKCTVEIYPHADMQALAAQLAASDKTHKLIISDGVFSMDGTIAPLPDLLRLAQEHQAWLIIDDAHGIGALGAAGAGCADLFGVQQAQRLIIMGTLGKAAGLSGAFVVAPAAVIDWLVQAARPYIYTTASSPAMAHAICASVDLMRGDEGIARRLQLDLLIQTLRSSLQQLLQTAPAHWQLAPSSTAIQPLIVGDNASALQLSALLREQGFWVTAIRPPTVAAGTARLRFTLSAAHTREDIEQLMAAFQVAIKGLGA